MPLGSVCAVSCGTAPVDDPLDASEPSGTSNPDGGISEATGNVVFGILSDFAPGDELAALRVIVTENGAVTRDQTLSVSDTRAPLSFPMEVTSGAWPRDTPIELELQAFATTGSDPIVTRRATTTVIEGFSPIFRVRLEKECVPGETVVEGLVAPTCTDDLTCIGASCEDPHVIPHVLEPYSTDWADPPPDGCKKAAGAKPVAEFGIGEDGFEPLGPEGEMPAHGGLQGGFHVYAGVRIQSLFGSGTTTQILMDDGAGKVDFTKSAQPYDAFDADSCAVEGIRFVLPYESEPGTPQEKIQALVGKTFRVELRVVDKMGDLACEVRWIAISDDITPDD